MVIIAGSLRVAYEVALQPTELIGYLGHISTHESPGDDHYGEGVHLHLDVDFLAVTQRVDHGSQYLSLTYSNRLADLGIQASTGPIGDSYDNALAETINGLHKNELGKARKPWRSIEEVELATLKWVWWFNNSRLHSEPNYQTPVEYQDDYYHS